MQLLSFALPLAGFLALFASSTDAYGSHVVVNGVFINTTNIVAQLMQATKYIHSKWNNGCLDGGHDLYPNGTRYGVYPNDDCPPYSQVCSIEVQFER